MSSDDQVPENSPYRFLAREEKEVEYRYPPLRQPATEENIRDYEIINRMYPGVLWELSEAYRSLQDGYDRSAKFTVLKASYAKMVVNLRADRLQFTEDLIAAAKKFNPVMGRFVGQDSYPALRDRYMQLYGVGEDKVMQAFDPIIREYAQKENVNSVPVLPSTNIPASSSAFPLPVSRDNRIQKESLPEPREFGSAPRLRVDPLSLSSSSSSDPVSSSSSSLPITYVPPISMLPQYLEPVRPRDRPKSRFDPKNGRPHPSSIHSSSYHKIAGPGRRLQTQGDTTLQLFTSGLNDSRRNGVYFTAQRQVVGLVRDLMQQRYV